MEENLELMGSLEKPGRNGTAPPGTIKAVNDASSIMETSQSE
jgi:hypothetical protein